MASDSSSSSSPAPGRMIRGLRNQDSHGHSPLPFSSAESVPRGGQDSIATRHPQVIAPHFQSHLALMTHSVPFYPPQAIPYYGGGLPPGAHDFVVNGGASFVETQNIIAPNIPSEVIRWITHYIIQGAEYDSRERDPPPRCHPETRTTILQRAKDWIADPARQKRLLWVRGPAGVGKSAIVQTLTEDLSESHRLGASLFFSRLNGRSNPQQVFPTLACQLAIHDPSYKAYLTELMHVNPRSLEKAMGEQFRLLIIEPFVQRKLRDSQADLIIAIDGLDECDGDPDQINPGMDQLRLRTSDRVQCEIIRLIGDFVLKYPSVPLVWIIASRPETHLKAVFSDEDIVNAFWEEDVPIDSDEACRDVEIFLHNEFNKIRKNYPDHIIETPWPSNDKFLRIAKAASGLFVFAEVVVRFIDNSRVGNPIAHLDYVLAALSRLRSAASRQNPLATLDAIYTAILGRVPKEVLQTTKELLAVFLLTYRRKVTEFPLSKIRKPISVSVADALTALRQLHSVISFPKVKDQDKTRPRFYHASFRDYLLDRSRSQEYFAGPDVLTERLLHYYLPYMFHQTPMAVEAFDIPELDHPVDKSVSYKMLQNILTSASADGVPSVSFISRDYSISDAQVQTILEGLNFSQMVKEDDLSLLNPLKLWDESRFPIEELKRRQILSMSSISSLGISPSTILQNSSITQLLSSCVLHVGTPASTKPYTWIDHEKENVKRAFASLISDAPETKVWIWGHKEGEKCAVIWNVKITSPSYTRYLRAMYIVGI